MPIIAWGYFNHCFYDTSEFFKFLDVFKYDLISNNEQYQNSEWFRFLVVSDDSTYVHGFSVTIVIFKYTGSDRNEETEFLAVNYVYSFRYYHIQ